MSDEAHDCEDEGAPQLTRAETLVLWAIRAWVAGHRHGIPVQANLRTAFRNEGAPAAAEAVDDLMGFIANGAGRTIQVNCPRCRQVTEDERLMLDIVALHQQGETLWVPFLARAILTPAATRLCGPIFAAVADALQDGGIALPAVAGQVPPPEAVVHAVPMGTTIH
ncbi:hypothetical protein [Inquilinus sp.]|jgi:hypothetical protein|uniref:hypothetical protein n=1 Tax=Inquilinus sp. TaxID=1932117 RepID=UPI0037848EC3